MIRTLKLKLISIRAGNNKMTDYKHEVGKEVTVPIPKFDIFLVTEKGTGIGIVVQAHEYTRYQMIKQAVEDKKTDEIDFVATCDTQRGTTEIHWFYEPYFTKRLKENTW